MDHHSEHVQDLLVFASKHKSYISPRRRMARFSGQNSMISDGLNRIRLDLRKYRGARHLLYKWLL